MKGHFYSLLSKNRIFSEYNFFRPTSETEQSVSLSSLRSVSELVSCCGLFIGSLSSCFCACCICNATSCMVLQLDVSMTFALSLDETFGCSLCCNEKVIVKLFVKRSYQITTYFVLRRMFPIRLRILFILSLSFSASTYFLNTAVGSTFRPCATI